jgi:pyridoxine 5-phosphate synthase
MVTLVPERREERTTEGGLDIVHLETQLTSQIRKLIQAGITVSLFIEPKPLQIEASKQTGATFVELHTGEYADNPRALEELVKASHHAHDLGLRVNAGHGLTYENVGPIVKLPYLEELNIGHNIICRAVFTGLGPAVREMKALLS